VGGTAAYALLLGSVCCELLLVDTRVDVLDGQVRDLSDATCRENSSKCVRAGTYKEAGQCDIVVITTGSRRSIGETTLELIYRSTAILHTVIDAMKPFRSDTVLLLVSNPVDVLTSCAQELSGLPKSQVIGCGTFLDTVRLRGMLAAKAGIAASAVDAYVLGEHGDAEFVPWSIASISGIPIDEVLPPDRYNRAELARECKNGGHRIVETKGVIVFGIGSVVSSVCSTILLDKRNVCTVSHFQPDLDCCLSVPAVIGRKGIVRTISLPMNSHEKAKLSDSATRLRDIVARIKDDILQDRVI